MYNGIGSLESVKEGEKTTSCQYDLLNRQTSVQMPDGRVQENLYDGEGLRAGIRECGKLSTFLYYNGEILAECNGESMPIRRHLPGMSSLQTLEDGQYHACHQDEKGSTIYITGRDGAVENCYVYDAFGNTLEKKEGIQNRIQYTGQQYDQETGQYYLRARYYNPAVGRFTQEDTYRGDGLNLYAYCRNNLVVYYDPSGHDLVVNSSNGPETTNTSGVEKENLGNSSTDVRSSLEASGYYQDANGRWHRPNNQFASNAEIGITSPIKGSSGSHGNSLSDPRTNYGYALVDRDTNEILKFGETIHPTTRYSQNYLDTNNAKMVIME